MFIVSRYDETESYRLQNRTGQGGIRNAPRILDMEKLIKTKIKIKTTVTKYGPASPRQSNNGKLGKH